MEQGGFEKVEGTDEHRQVKVKWIQEPLGEKPDREADQEPGQQGCEDNEYVLLCKSERRGAKEQAIYSEAEGRFIEALEALRSRIETGRLKDPQKIQRAIGRVQAKHPRVQRFYRLELTQPAEQAGEKKCALCWARRDQAYEEEAQLLGSYVLRTNRDHFSGPELWRMYMTLTRAEKGFKALKSNLGLRPNHHQIERRVEGHVFITILAYQLLRFIEYTLEQQGDTRCWRTIKRILQTHTYAPSFCPLAMEKSTGCAKRAFPYRATSRFTICSGSLGTNYPQKRVW